MTSDDFQQLCDARLTATRYELRRKTEHYNTGVDALAAFKNHRYATPEQALWGFLRKHLRFLEDTIVLETDISPEQWQESTGDVIKYMLCLEGLRAEATRGAE